MPNLLNSSLQTSTVPSTRPTHPTCFDSLPPDSFPNAPNLHNSCARTPIFPLSRPTHTAYPTCFDSLSPEVLSNIVSWMDIIWRDKSELWFMDYLLSETSPFRTTTPSLFSQVLFRGCNENTGVNVGCSTAAIASQDLDADTQPLIRKFFKTCGSFVREVTITDRDGEHNELEQFTALVIKHCPNVNALKIISSWNFKMDTKLPRELMNAYASQLRSIECGRIGQLGTTDLSVCTNLKRFVCGFGHTSLLTSALKSFGSNLEQLVIRVLGGGNYVQFLDEIRSNCKQLVTLSLNRDVCRGNKYAWLLCSYGAQLVEADIQALDFDNLRRVCHHCPSLRIVFSIEEGERNGEEWNYVAVIGSLLDEFKAFNVRVRKDIQNAMARCTRLRTFHLHRDAHSTVNVITDEEMCVMFSSANYFTLENLRMNRFMPSRENLNMVAASTSNLKSLILSLVSPIKNADEFRVITKSNPHLNQVSIKETLDFDFKRSACHAKMIMCYLMATFSKCRDLNFNLQLSEHQNVSVDELRELAGCVPSRGVKLNIVIGDSKYQQRGW